MFLGGSGGGGGGQKILKIRSPEMPFPAIWALIFSAKIAIDDDLFINLTKQNYITLIQKNSKFVTVSLNVRAHQHT